MQSEKPEDYEIRCNEMEKAVDDILDEMINDKDLRFEGEAVNWGDLSCNEVKYVAYSTLVTQPYYEIEITEVSPSSSGFLTYILDRLEEEGFKEDKIIILNW